MFKSVVAILTSVVLLASTGAAQEKKQQSRIWPQEPTAFRFVPWGISEAEAMKLIKDYFFDVYCFSGDASDRTDKQRICSARFPLGSVSVASSFIFSDDKFVQVVGFFNSDNYSTVRDAFDDKYGHPMSVEKSTVRTKAGVEYSQEELEWDGPKVHIHLSRFGDNVTQGYFEIVTQEYHAQILRGLEDKRRKLKDAI
jgi:hypothetical protein